MTFVKKKFSVLLFVGILLFVNCLAPYKALVPDGFAQYSDIDSFKAVSPEGIVFEVRHKPNKPGADLFFWREALRTQFTENGLNLITDTITTYDKHEIVHFEYIVPFGEYDYRYIIGLQVTPKNIIITEIAGKTLEIEKRRADLMKAFYTVHPQKEI